MAASPNRRSAPDHKDCLFGPRETTEDSPDLGAPLLLIRCRVGQALTSVRAGLGVDIRLATSDSVMGHLVIAESCGTHQADFAQGTVCAGFELIGGTKSV